MNITVSHHLRTYAPPEDELAAKTLQHSRLQLRRHQRHSCCATIDVISVDALLLQRPLPLPSAEQLQLKHVQMHSRRERQVSVNSIHDDQGTQEKGICVLVTSLCSISVAYFLLRNSNNSAVSLQCFITNETTSVLDHFYNL